MASDTPNSKKYAVEPAEFRKVMSAYPTGVVAVTAMIDGDPTGMIVGSFGSVSLTPPLVSFTASHSSSSYQKLRKVNRLMINVLAAEQLPVCQSLSSKTLKNRWSNVKWNLSRSELPMIDDSLAHIECNRFAVHQVGDHDIVICEVSSMSSKEDGRPLIFLGSEYSSTVAR
ncbi:NADH-FMN oxidoreductase RutF, flavin reductase (DIM6/NTAB) family [Roseovarius pacificus]|uniref:NADH-FMN oxidoreductase RutF, flavin reductase (DIM6/NTAB) family n=1 Tax=Roseovarius pacificus TaxID=337701 RepID=A0A1M7KK58_9RHOB|nr:flavin reductase family protein [Roseovarius pacificus]GGO62955.1 hypothetical protein GCM10011315_43150 [Roseovarius pacificus]SHM65771.1 NADH-FMN oxidoreductase RutF, flavin reductase (DIM6/NTAB) family [Roseovarius pacificus]